MKRLIFAALFNLVITGLSAETFNGNFDSKIISQHIAKYFALLKPYYLKDFDLEKIVLHLQNKQLKFDETYDFNTGIKMSSESEEMGYRFSIEKPKIARNKTVVTVIISSGVL